MRIFTSFTLLSAITLLFAPNFSNAQCTTPITSYPYQQGFEDGFGDWTGDVNNTYTIGDWLRDSDATASAAATGPTSAVEGTWYTYLEATNSFTQTANIEGPCFSLPSNSAPFFRFNYHMYGANMGTLVLELDTSLGSTFSADVILWTEAGNQGNVWLSDTVDLSNYAGSTVRIRFRGVIGSGFLSDMAIDNLVLSSGVTTTPAYCVGGDQGTAAAEVVYGTGPYTYAWSAGGTGATKTGLTAGSYTVTVTDASASTRVIDFTIEDGNVPVLSGLGYTEGFETSLSPWFNDSINDDFDWTRNSGGTPTGTTGPVGANEGSWYVYTEASFLTGGFQAFLTSPCIDLDSLYMPYFVFDYHMLVNGGGGSNADMGSTWIIADLSPETPLTGDTLWEQIGATGFNWLTDSVDLSAYAGEHVTLRIVGELSTGISQYGDRAFDNFKIKDAVKVTESCNGTTGGSIAVDPQFGTSPYTYLWSTGSTQASITNLGSGTYTVTVTDNASNTLSRSITVIAEPTPPSPSTISATTTQYCSNDLQSSTLSIQFLNATGTYSVNSNVGNDLGPQNTVGQPFNVSINGNHPFATGDATLTIYYRGDIEAPGEIANTYSENGTLIGQANTGTQQCGVAYAVETFTIPADSVNAWIEDNQIGLLVTPVGMTRYCGTGANRYSLEAYYNITYPYSKYTPYWFSGSCGSLTSNAIDSGYIVEVSPNTTTTFYVRNYNAVCDTWGSCQSVQISVNTPPSVTTAPPNPFYCGTPTTLTASGASTYTWSPGTGLNQTTGSSVQASPSVTTNYQVIGVDGNACSDTTYLTVSVTSGPSASISSTNISCNGAGDGSATVTTSGGTGTYTYLWSNGSTSTTITNLSAGTYTVTVSDGTTCQAIQSVNITQPANINTTVIGNNIGCSGFNSGSAFAFVSGGTPSYSYSWSNGSTNSAIFALAAGTYTVTVTDNNGCTDVESVTITQPSSALTSSITSTTNVSCFGGNNGSATAAGSGGTPGYSYSWSSGANGATATGLTAGSYVVTVVDANGCQSVSFATITQPATAVSVSITSSTDVTCNGGNDGAATASGSGGTGTITYNWSSSSSTATASTLTAGVYTVTATDANGCTDTAMVTIAEPPLLGATYVITNVSCNGGSDGAIAATGTGGNGGPYTFAWSSGGGTSMITGLTAGTYTVTITDNLGCTGTSSATVTEPTVLSASATANNNVSCNGGNDGSATASANGGTSPYSFAWSGGAGSTATVTGLAAGTYTVTATDDNGCTATASVTITEPTPLSASAVVNNNVSCFGGSDGSATASALGGTSPYSYAWSGGGGSAATASSLSAGTYTVTITDDNGCTATANVTITQPATAVSAAIVSSSNVSCNGGNDGSATAAGSGGTSPYSYAWSGGAGSTAAVTGLAAGTYTVTVTDDNGCTATASVVITEPALLTASTTVNNNVSCNGGSDGSATATANGGTSPYSYAWSGGAGSAATASGLAAGTYTVTVTDDNGCTTTATAIITEPTVLSASATANNNVSCNGGNDGSATASANGGTSPYSFAWSGGAGSTATVTGLAAGTYTVTATDDNGCTATASVTITQPTPLSASAVVNNNVSCFGGSDGSATASALGGTSPYSYAWSGGAGSAATASALSAGAYTVTVTDDNGCTATASVVITEPATAVSAAIASSSNVSCNGGNDGTATAAGSGGTSPYSYTWSGGAGSTAAVTGLAAGTYTVTVTDDNGCTATASVVITEPAVLSILVDILNDVSCNGGNDGSIITVTTGGTAPFTYNWSNGPTTANNLNLVAGTYSVTVTDNNGCTSAISAFVQEPDTISNQFTILDASCNGNMDGSISATGDGGTAPYTYAWNGGGSTNTISGLGAGTYTVTITDDNGCTNSFEAEITEPAVLIASIVFEDSVNCAGDSTGLAIAAGTGGTVPYSYAWPAGFPVSNDTILQVPAGSYTVTITDDNGCTSTATANIGEYPAIVLSIATTVDVTCVGGNDGYASVNASGGSGLYTYLWPDGGTAFENDSLTGGTHCITVTDGFGCDDTVCVSLNEINSLPVVDLGPDTSLCDTVYTLDAGSAISYSWNTTENTQTIEVNASGQYTVTITDGNGCENSDEVNVTFYPYLSFNASVDSTQCTASTATAFIDNLTGGGGYLYTWSNGPTGVDTVYNLGLGGYSVTVSDINGCSATDTFTVYENSDLSFTIASADVSCFGLSDGYATAITSGGVSPFSYNWSTSSTNDSILNLSAGTYSLTLTDDNGCVRTDTVEIDQPEEITFNLSLNLPTCEDSNGYAAVTNITPAGSYTYQWNDYLAQTNDTAFTLPAGIYTVTVTASNGCTKVGSAILNNLGSASLTMSAQDETCEGLNDGAATVSATGGTAPLNYLWNDPSAQTTTTASNLGAGVYYVTVTDDQNCISIDSVSVNTLNPLPVINLGPDTTLCADSYVLKPGSGFASYAWNTTATSDTLLVTSTGTYTVTVTNAAGCSSIDSASVTLHVPISVSATITNSSCALSSGSIALSVLTGNGGYSYAWNTGDTTSAITDITAGNYTVTVSDTIGCDIVETYTVNYFNAPSIDLVSIDATCFGDNTGSALLTLAGGTPPFDYSWNTGATTAGLNGVSAGTYTLTVTDDSGCVVMDTINIGEAAPINISITGSQPTCGNNDGALVATISNTQGPVNNMIWDDPANSTTASISSLFAGFYTITVTDSAGCSASESYALSDLGSADLTMQSTMNNCSNENTAFASVLAAGNAPFSYMWNLPTPQTNDTIFDLFNGTYAVSVTDINGCVAIGSVDVQSMFDAPVVDLGEEKSACFGTNVILTPGGGYSSYFWTGGSTTPSIIATGSQVYGVTVSDANGCFGTDTVNVVLANKPVVDLGPDTVICTDDVTPGFTLDAGEGFGSYSWSTLDTTQTILINQGGQYGVTVTNVPGCFGSDQIIVVYDTCVNVPVENVSDLTAPQLIVYPNPNRGQFNIEARGMLPGIYQVKLLNASGQMVQSVPMEIKGGMDITKAINVESTARGVYLLIFEGEQLRLDQRVIIQ